MKKQRLDILLDFTFLFSKKNSQFDIDKRPLLMLLLIIDLIEKNKELNSHNLYQHINRLESNIEWIAYIQDISINDEYFYLGDKAKLIQSNPFCEIILYFFKVEQDGIDITNMKEKWSDATHLVRLKKKIEEFTNIIAPTFSKIQCMQEKLSDMRQVELQIMNGDEQYNIEYNIEFIQFTFNEDILQSILQKIIYCIPEMKQIKTNILSPIEKCFIERKSTKKSCLDYLNQCIAGKNTSECKNYMMSDNYEANIINEINNISLCDATDILIRFGFKHNGKYFESYDDWECRTIVKIKISSINPKLVLYLKLLIERVNPFLTFYIIMPKQNIIMVNY